MRWIIVFFILYTVPIIVLFKNYKNFKRSCVYGSMYVVVVTTIAITNIYTSSLNKIEELVTYQNYAFDEAYENDSNKKEDTNIEEYDEDESLKDEDESHTSKHEEEVLEVDNFELPKDHTYTSNNIKSKQVIDSIEQKEEDIIISDEQKVEQFKSDIYTIERKALIPMRESMDGITSVSKALQSVDEIKDDLEYAKEMCDEVIAMYDEMEVPKLEDENHTYKLEQAKNDVRVTYEIRKEAMELGLKLAESKNFKYIGEIVNHLKLSDTYIESFKNRVDEVKQQLN